MANKKVKPVEDLVHKELENLKGMLARALADYDNLSKRVERERQDLGKIASVGVIIKLLPVLDNLERAQEHLKDSGLAIALGEFKTVLKEEGLEEIPVKVGETLFTSKDMEAIEVIKSEDKNMNGKVAGLILSGWRIGSGDLEMVIRPAKVKVYNLERINN